MLEIYPWQKKQMTRLSTMSSQKRLPHGLLLTGPKGIGLKQFSLVFAMRILCESKETNLEFACGGCKSCELFKASTHPDLKFIEVEEDKKSISVKQIREMIEYVSLKSFSTIHKVIIINQADIMQRSASAALLKTLEEPPEQSILILLSHQHSKLPITIRSRCHRIDFKPTYDEIAIGWLNVNLENTELSPNLLLHLTGGGPLRSLELANEEDLMSRHELVSDLNKLSDKTSNPLKIAAHWHELGAENTIPWLLQIFNDLAKLKLTDEKARITNLDLREDLQGLANTLDLLKLVRSYDYILLKYRELTGVMNYSPVSILEEIALFWKNYDATNVES